MTSLPQTQQNLPARKPRIAIMGEFSSGKSTLTNLLLGADPLPTKVTATQLPPVWISQGVTPHFFEDHQGRNIPFDIRNIFDINLEETLVVRLFLDSDILEMCDLIDMPGISDPNMPAEVWERLVDELDCVIWCTPANQSWRQSEAAVWDSFPETLQAKSLLLVTHSDKLRTETELSKVLKRVKQETHGLFAGVYPISVTQALTAQDDPEIWEQSGADAFVNHFVDILSAPFQSVFDRVSPATSAKPAVIETGITPPEKPLPTRSAQSTFTTVKAKSGPKTPRPPRDDAKVTFQDVYFDTEIPDHRVARE